MPPEWEITFTTSILRAQINLAVLVESFKLGPSTTHLGMRSDLDDFIKAYTNVRTSKDGTYQDFLKEGNLRYKRGELFEAAAAYTRCVCLSAVGDVERAKALASRGAVLMSLGRFEESVIDSERALQHAYPEKLRFRLHLRKAQCYKELGQLLDAENEMRRTRELIAASQVSDEQKKEIADIAEKTFAGRCEVKTTRVRVEYTRPPELSFGTDELRPCLSTAVEIATSEKYGRHFVATRDLQTGDVMLKEEPAVCGLKSEAKWTHCAHCFRPSYTLYPCNTCNKVLYCCDECEKAASPYHEVICIPRKKYEDEFKAEYDLSENIFSSFARIFDFLAFLGVENCANYDNPSHPRSERFRLLTEFLTLIHHPLPYEEQIKSLCSDIIKHCFQISDNAKVAKLAEFCNLALLKHNANSFSIEECFIYDQSDEIDLKHVAYGSYHVASLCNHSCDPNVVCTYYGKTMVGRAARPIKKGDQLFIRYCNLFYNLPKETRRERLSQYNFECDCDACRFDWPVAKLMAEDPSFFLGTDAPNLKNLVRKESHTSGLAMKYADIAAVETFELARMLQRAYFEPAASRLDQMYKLIQMVIFYHWAVNTRTFKCDPCV
ncbi:uncharacterized protein LOC135937648 [Cloeon dipterum]|uniref:uncharacterized protein LOC135937648 n=1 Tax=Cloeon dipterum TaxID=197152 RepID=UPI00322037E6